MNSGAFIGVFTDTTVPDDTPVTYNGSPWEVNFTAPLRRSFVFRSVELNAGQYVDIHAPVRPSARLDSHHHGCFVCCQVVHVSVRVGSQHLQ